MTSETGITLRYWAAAKAATGIGEEVVETDVAVSLAALVAHVHAAHPSPRVREVVAVCSVLVDETPLGGRDPEDLLVAPGGFVDFLPPFAGG